MKKITLAEAIEGQNTNKYEIAIGDRYVEVFEKKTGKLVLTVTRRYYQSTITYNR